MGDTVAAPAEAGRAGSSVTRGSVSPGGSTAAPPRNNLLWAIGGLAFVAVVVIVAAQRASTAPVGPAGMAPPMAGGARAPDISQMSPRERASRLFDRVMRLDAEGKSDSVRLFAPMALAAHEAVGTFDLDLRYDYGRIAEVSGNLDVAAAQADSILREAPDHLLGLILAMRVAQDRGDNAAADSLRRRLLAARDGELAKGLQEYQLHRNDIDAALAAAGSAGDRR